jgi:hypothetical protein
MSTPNRLGGLIQPKGSAQRPAEIPQRGEPVTVTAAQPAHAPADPVPPKRVLKSLTLKLEEPEYEVLREFAHRQRKTHQEVMHEAVMRYLQAESKQ